eukprot:g8155.t1
MNSSTAPYLPECQLPTPSVTDTTQSSIDTNKDLTSGELEDNIEQLLNASSKGVSTKASFRAWISAEKDCYEKSGLDTRETSVDEFVMFQNGFQDLSILNIWQKDEEMKMTRKSSLTRQRPTSSLNTSDCLVEEILATSPFHFPECQTDNNNNKQNISPFAKAQPILEKCENDESDCLMVSCGGESQKVSLRMRIMWKIRKLRKRQAKKLAEYGK